MEIRTDIPLRGTAWDSAIVGYNGIFEPATLYMICMLSLAIGIMYEKRIAVPDDYKTEASLKYVGKLPRTNLWFARAYMKQTYIRGSMSTLQILLFPYFYGFMPPTLSMEEP